MKNEAPILLVFEGPSGTGKTTLQHHLGQYLQHKNLKIKILPEFSTSPLGRIIAQYSKFGHELPFFLRGLNGALAYLSDKLYLLEKNLSSANEILILDRFILSQWILGSYFIKDEHSKQVLQQIIMQTKKWIEANFSQKSVIILLQSSSESLVARLEKREEFILDSENKAFLQQNVSDYNNFDYNLFEWNKLYLNSERPLPETLENLIHDIDKLLHQVNHD
ncbi:MAG: hypothetical protein NW226_13715 [Microscillaceae bacterium]|nr:hypothetical protein [Microscillaceae bacterium]